MTRSLRNRFLILVVGAAVAALLTPANALAAAAGFTCAGGSVPAGTYSRLHVNGFCAVDQGTVHVTGNVTIAPGAGLNAAFGGSDLIVGRNVIVESGAILVLGCEPEAFICFNDPDQTHGTLSTHDRVGRNLVGDDALMMLIHNNWIGRNASQSGGGGGDTCANFPLGPDGPPAYSTYEDNRIRGNASISGVTTCWLGFIRNHVGRNTNYTDNVTNDPDGNEVVSNTVAGNLNCSGNDPAPQVGDSGGVPNTVGGHKNGQCANLF